MATFREMAVAAHTAAQQAAKDTLVSAARAAVAPVLTDPAGKVMVDPKTLLVALADPTGETVVLSTPEPDAAVRTHLLVRAGEVRLTWQDSGAWRKDGAVVKTLVEAGAALQAEAAA